MRLRLANTHKYSSCWQKNVGQANGLTATVVCKAARNISDVVLAL